MFCKPLLFLNLLLCVLLVDGCSPSRARLADPAVVECLNRQTRLLGRTGGPTTAVAVARDYAYVGYSYEFAVVEASDLTAMNRVGYLPISANDIVLQAPLAYVAGRDGLTIVDVTEPTAPRIVGQLATVQPAVDVELTGDGAALLIVDHRILLTVDVTDPARPRRSSSTEPGERIDAVATAGAYAYLATNSGLAILDISTVDDPHQVGAIRAEWRWSHGIVVQEGIAYLTNLDGLAIVDVAEPSNPRLISLSAVEGSTAGLAVRDGIVYIANGSHGVRLVDVTNPARPALLARVPVDGGVVSDVVLQTNRLFANDTNGQVYVLDVTDPVQTAPVALFRSPGVVTRVEVQGDKVYLTAGWRDRFHIVDASDPAVPRSLGSYDVGGGKWALAPNYGFAYALAASGRMHGIETAEAASLPAADSGPALQPAADSANSASYVLLPEAATLHAFDISNPRAPLRTGVYSAGANITHLALQNGLIYLAAGDHGLHILYLGATGDPTIVTSTVVPSYAGPLTLYETRIYVADRDAGIHVLDGSTPSQPALLATAPVAGSVLAVAADAHYLYAGIDGDGIQVYDLANLASPLCRLPAHNAVGLELVDGRLYVADGIGGLLIYNALQYH